MKQYKEMLLVNGKMIECTITIDADHDDMDLDVSGLEPKDIQDLERKIQRGDLSVMNVLVTVSVFGLSGQDSLGGCYISSPEHVQNMVNEYSMIRTATIELEKKILKMLKNLQIYSK